MLKTDLTRIRQFEQPMFCILVNQYKDDGDGKYCGLGYSFDINTWFPKLPDEIPAPDFTQYTINILGLEIDGRLIFDYDFSNSENNCEIRVGDTVRVDIAYFQFLMGEYKDDWVYPAHQVEFIEVIEEK